MIKAYTGFPGSGKTFALTHIAWKEQRKGRKVFTNYPVKGCYKITYDDLVKYTFPVGSVVLIDEAGRYFNSRDWSKLPPAVFDLFTLHRHMKLDLIVAVQNFQRIDLALREVIELVYWARNKPWLPFFVYEGYYAVEKVGMKGEADVRHVINKFSRSRKAYDTHAMRSVGNKTHIPLVSWDEELKKEIAEEQDGTNPEDAGGGTLQGTDAAAGSDRLQQLIEEDSPTNSVSSGIAAIVSRLSIKRSIKKKKNARQ